MAMTPQEAGRTVRQFEIEMADPTSRAQLEEEFGGEHAVLFCEELPSLFDEGYRVIMKRAMNGHVEEIADLRMSDHHADARLVIDVLL